MTVAGPFPSQSLIRSGFCRPAIFRVKAPARTPCSGSFSKGSRAKTHVRVKSQLAKIARLVEPRLMIPGGFYRIEKINGKRDCHYTLFLAQTKGSVSSTEGKGGVAPLKPPCPIFKHLGMGPSRTAQAYTSSGSGPRDAYLSRKRSQRSLQDKMDLGGSP
jgi:hypothetical protein